MSKMFRITVLIILLSCGYVHAQELLDSMDGKNVSVLNEELRKNRANTAQARGSLTGGTTGQYLTKASDSNYDTVWYTLTIPTHGYQVFTSSGTFTAPAGVTQVCISGCGAGGGGGAGPGQSLAQGAGGGGASGKCVINYPYTVVSGNSYTVTLNNGGSGGAGVSGLAGNSGSAGGTTVFDGLTIAGGLGGGGGTGNTFGTGGSSANKVFGISISGVTGTVSYTGGDGAGGAYGTGGAGRGNATVGDAGTGYGSGGGGGGGNNSGSEVVGPSGGAGTKGILIVSW